MRLEQGAQSYAERSVASHGAFAILYGRRLKHYIKKPEVTHPAHGCLPDFLSENG